MRDRHDRERWDVERVRLVLGEGAEHLSGDQERRRSALVHLDGIVETPRGTGASIAESAEGDVRAIDDLVEVRTRSRRVRLLPVDELGNPCFA